MSITIVKKKAPKTVEPEAVAEEAQTAETLEEQVVKKLNQLGDLYLKLKPIKTKTKKITDAYKPLFAAVQDFVDIDSKPDDEVTLKTDKYAADFGQHGNQSSVTAPGKAFKMLEKVEKGLGQKLMTFGITDLKKYLTPEQVLQVTKTERTKARTVVIIPIADAVDDDDS